MAMRFDENMKNTSAVVRFVVYTVIDFSQKQVVNSSMQFVIHQGFSTGGPWTPKGPW